MKEFILKNKVTIIIDCLLVLLAISGVSFGVYMYFQKPDSNECSDNSISYVSEEEKKDIEDVIEPVSFYIEVKGAVKKPGVYLMNEGQIINDAITKAGGFKSTSYSDNINLSMKLSSEMVIYVYTKTEYKKLNVKPEETVTAPVCNCPTVSISDCLNSGSSVIENQEKEDNPNKTDTPVEKEEDKKEDKNNAPNNSQLVNINSATIDELMSLNGVGESKAKSIIEYRNQVGKFKSIEELKNVSGIGDTIYEKIKNSITV